MKCYFSESQVEGAKVEAVDKKLKDIEDKVRYVILPRFQTKRCFENFFRFLGSRFPSPFSDSSIS